MKRVFVLTILILMAFSLSIIFADGWVNAENEIQKSVQENSTRSPSIEFINLVASMTNVQQDISKDMIDVTTTLSSKKACGTNEPYVSITFFNAQKIKDVLEGRESFEKYLLDNKKVQGIAVYSGENLNKFFSCPNPMNMGTYTITNAGTHDFALSFMAITTNASIIIKMQDSGYVTNVASSNEKMPSWYGFVSLNASITSLLNSLMNSKDVSRKEVEKILFKEPTKFKRAFKDSPASFKVVNSSHNMKISLWSWWMRTYASYDTPAGIYSDEVKITVFADVKDW